MCLKKIPFLTVITCFLFFLTFPTNADVVDNFYDGIIKQFIQWYEEQEITAKLKLQYAEFLGGSDILRNLPYQESIKLKTKVKDICKELTIDYKGLNLSENEKYRLLVLGIIVSDDFDDKKYFADLLEKQDPDNGLSAVCLIKFYIDRQDWSSAQDNVKKLLKCKYVKYYDGTGADLNFGIWTKCFGNGKKSIDNFNSINLLPYLSLNQIVSDTYSLKEYARYRNKWHFPSKEQERYLPLDLFYLSHAKMGDQLYGWFFYVHGTQLDHFMDLYGDKRFPDKDPTSKKARFYITMVKYQNFLEEQKQALWDLAEAHIEVLSHVSDSEKNNILKLEASGNDWQVYNSLGKYNVYGVWDGLVDEKLDYLIDLESYLWEEIINGPESFEEVIIIDRNDGISDRNMLEALQKHLEEKSKSP
ncbi:MAG: hypothetical protein ACYSSP_11025 [Planctomycetota bacterium]|jgi:hypothetical protein